MMPVLKFYNLLYSKKLLKHPTEENIVFSRNFLTYIQNFSISEEKRTQDVTVK